MFRLFCLCYCLFISLSLNSQVGFESSNLPIFIINTIDGILIPDEPKSTAELQVIDNGDGERNYLTDLPIGYDGKIGIEKRGSSSQSAYDKKSYAFETRNEDGSNNNVPLLGLPKENDWILYGPYGDKSLIRNAMAYDLAGQIMEYAPRYRFCEVVINDNYQGVFLLLEKIKRDKNRVDIAKLSPEDNNGAAVTGGYIIKLDKETGLNNDGWNSPYRPVDGGYQQTYYQFHYPKADDITVNQIYYIENYVRKWERLMREPDPIFNDSLEGYQKYIDPATFIDYILVNELCKNVDAYRLSTYLYKDRDGSNDSRLKAGPVWDFNLGFGNVDFCAGPEPTGWVLDYNNICPDDFWLTPFYWNKLRTDERFALALQDRWKSLRESIWTKELLCGMIEEKSTSLTEAQQRNFQRWDILGNYVWPNAFIGETYAQEIEYLKTWLMDRVDWMDGAMEDFRPYSPIGEEGTNLVYPNPYTSTAILEFDGTANFFYELFIYNSLGQVVASLSVPRQSIDRFFVELPELEQAGLYFYSVLSNGKLITAGSFRKI